MIACLSKKQNQKEVFCLWLWLKQIKKRSWKLGSKLVSNELANLTDGVHQLVDDDAEVDTAGAERHGLGQIQ